VLDAGCGTGEHVLMCAGLGLDATGPACPAWRSTLRTTKHVTRGLTARFINLDVRRPHQDRTPAAASPRQDQPESSAMLAVEAQIQTERPNRYLAQFCKHAASMGGGRHGSRMHLGNALARREVQVHADWSDTHGIVTFTPWGQCTITASADTLTLRAEAADKENLRKIQDIITRDLGRFGQRDGLAVNWQPAHTPEAPAGLSPDSADKDGRGAADAHRVR